MYCEAVDHELICRSDRGGFMPLNPCEPKAPAAIPVAAEVLVDMVES